jgi:tetratricopeptide (TPR) repeat protein
MTTPVEEAIRILSVLSRFAARRSRKTASPSLLAATLFVSGLFADSAETLFNEGNRLYQAAQYQAALDKYSQISRLRQESGSIYFNMGNCYYKLQDVGRAILFYERALRLSPGDDDIQTNLAIAQLAAVDKIERQPDFILMRVVRTYFHLLPRDAQVRVVVGLYLALMACVILWVLWRGRRMGDWAGRFSLVLAFLLTLAGASLAGRWWEDQNLREAVILATKVEVMSTPGAQAVEVFSLHAGAKVTLDRTSGDWIEIILPDRKSGWVKREALEEI